MHLGTRLRPRFRPATRLLLLVALATASLTLTHCRMVGDRLNGVDAGIFRRSDECKKKCQDEYQARNQAEDALHQQLLAGCVGDPTCILNENARHTAAEAASKAQRDACLNACHQQGGGAVGQ
jgi:hypothetical protein